MIVEVSNGQDQIRTEYIPCLEYTDIYTADGFCYIFDIGQNSDDMPHIDQTDTMNLIMSLKVHVDEIEVFDSDVELIDTISNWGELPVLDAGVYYIKIHVYLSEDNLYIAGHAVFALNVN